MLDPHQTTVMRLRKVGAVWKFLSKRTNKMKEVFAVDELGQFFVTGPTDASLRPSQFYWVVCRKNVSILTH